MNRRHVLTVILMLTNVSAGLAQTAGMMSFQAFIKDGAGVPLSGPHDFLFEIIDNVSPTPNVLATFTQSGVQATQGVVSTKYGPVSPALFDGLTPGGATRRLRVTVTSLNPDLVLTPVDIVTPPAVAEQVNARGTGSAAVVTDGAGNVAIGATPLPQARFHVNGNSLFNGNVGIGTSMATQPLEVVGTGPDGGTAHFYSIDNRNRIYVSGRNGPGIQAVAAITLQDFNDATNSVNLQLVGSNGGGTPGDFRIINSNNEEFRLAKNGNVGIGTTTPLATLDVDRPVNGTSFLVRMRNQNASSPYTLQVLEPVGAAAGYPLIQATGNDFLDRFRVDSGSYTGLLVNALGNVGIGTTTPSARLCVNGSIAAIGALGTCSDARFKTNVAALGDALDTLAKLRAVRFDWRCAEFPDRNFDDKPQIGFIAQEVLDVVPEIVQQGSDGYYSVDYGRLTPVLTAAVQEMHVLVQKLETDGREKDAEIAALRATAARQQTAIDELAKRFERLEQAASAGTTHGGGK